MRARPRIDYRPHRGPTPHVLSIVLAGGEGKRLWPLTAERAKPAVSIGGRYRLVDFVLSNLVNSGFLKIKVLTIAAYWQANMDLVAVHPIFDLYNPRWPIRTWALPLPPAKFVFADEERARMGVATDSLVCEGCIISGGRIDRTIVGPGSRVNSFSHVEESILFDGVDVARHSRLRRVIVDKNVQIPPGSEIGYDLESDARRFTVVDGVVVIPKEAKIPAKTEVFVDSYDSA